MGDLHCASAYLVDSQVNAGIRDDAQHVWDVALVKRHESFFPENLLGAV